MAAAISLLARFSARGSKHIHFTRASEQGRPHSGAHVRERLHELRREVVQVGRINVQNSSKRPRFAAAAKDRNYDFTGGGKSRVKLLQSAAAASPHLLLAVSQAMCPGNA